MNKRIYIWTIVISILLLVPDCIWDCSLLSILSSIGCSCIAAAIMAIFLENAAARKEQIRQGKARNIYFKQLENQLKMLLERVLWFDARMSENNFNWNLEPTIYSSFPFMVFMSKTYSEETIPFKDAKIRLNEIEAKYTLDKQTLMTHEQLEKVQKMFQILAASSQYLLTEANNLKGNKVELDSENYISMEDTDQILFDISMGVGLMSTIGKNYGAAIASLVSAYEKIREIGCFTDDFRIGLHGSIEITEL
ncbi:MAG: hypothetical protein IJT29_03090 [Oscillospiraceae bacterium]|nr:hypothetical protein [Oscillospiraceae bacterium]